MSPKCNYVIFNNHLIQIYATHYIIPCLFIIRVRFVKTIHNKNFKLTLTGTFAKNQTPLLLLEETSNFIFSHRQIYHLVGLTMGSAKIVCSNGINLLYTHSLCRNFFVLFIFLQTVQTFLSLHHCVLNLRATKDQLFFHQMATRLLGYCSSHIFANGIKDCC